MADQPVRAVKTSVHLTMRLPPDYALLVAGISRDLGLTQSAFVRRCVERFVANEVGPDIAKALVKARRTYAA